MVEGGFFMLQNILQEPNLIFYILAAEVFLLCLLQLRTNGLLRKTYRLRIQKRDKVQQMKEEVKNGPSEIPVLKFEKQKGKAAEAKKPEKKGNYDQQELAVLQEMMAEFFG